jgi:hypothetical protein
VRVLELEAAFCWLRLTLNRCAALQVTRVKPCISLVGFIIALACAQVSRAGSAYETGGDEDAMAGFGHFGMSSLLVIQKIEQVW